MNAKQAFFVGLIVGLAIGACWMYAHMSCPECQRFQFHGAFDRVKRRLGLKLIE